MKDYTVRNRWTFGLGTIGRDMVYTLISMYLIFYLTDILNVSTWVMWWITSIMLFARIYDAANDPVMGFIVDNTRTRWGKFKPWIVIGAILTSVFTVLLFTDFGFTEKTYVWMFAIIYLIWGMSFTANDIAYWSMLPSLSMEQKEREKIGAIARICANIGLFAVVAGIVPLTEMLGKQSGNIKTGYFIFSIILVSILLAGQCVTLFGVKESRMITAKQQKTSLKDFAKAITQNDQLLYIAISMSLFMIGYLTTTTFGLYFFKYAYGDENMYSVFALVLGVSQVSALALFPLFSKFFERKKLFDAAMILIFVGYALFFFAPTDTMLFIGIAGVLLFVGQAFVQLLMLMFLSDTVDYGHWKLGKRNDSITLSLQPFINKMGGAISGVVVSAIIIVSGIKDAETAADVSTEGLLIMKFAMMVFPLICIIVSYIIYRKKFKIDSVFYGQILDDLKSRGELADGDNTEQ